MAEKLNDQQVADLLTILRGDASLDNKVQFVTNVKSAIKQHNVPDSCVAQLFEGLRKASTSQHAALVSAGFTSLNHLLTRLSRQEPKHLAKEAVRTLPVVIEKLGDQKDKYRALASQALTTFYAANPSEVERIVRTSAMSGKNPRAKETALHWLLQMHQEHGLQFRGYVPLLMELLEDADGMVRDAAKGTVIELFRNAPNVAKSDLKRQLKNFKVRPAIEQAIVKELAPTSSSRPDTPSGPTAVSARSDLAVSVSSLSSERPVTPVVPESQADPVDATYVNTGRELDDIFRGMAWYFEGRETEQNWEKREQNMRTLRKLIAGNASFDFHDAFIGNLKTMLDGIIKCLSSLRTSLSKEGCNLVEDIARTFGPAMEPMVELLMQTLLKMTAATKKISSQNASSTIDTMLSRLPYSLRLMQHIWSASQDKNVQPRTYVTGWLKTMLKKVASHKSQVEHTGGLDLIEKCIKKGLGDANPNVREKMRSTYWAFHVVWPARADAIMADLDSTAQKLLMKDPSNPNSPKKVDAPRAGLTRTTATASKPSLREAMLAQKRTTLAAAKNLPARPGSAMAHISPVRTTSNSSSHSGSSTTATKPTRARPESTISVNAGGMSVAPMRPSRRRPEAAARPATAGPYSVRDQPSSIEMDSPETLKAKLQTPRAKATPPRTSASRPRQQGHAPHASESSIPSPTSRMTSKPRASPRSPLSSPGKPRMPKEEQASSPSLRRAENTLVVPSMKSLDSASTVVDDVPEPEIEDNGSPVSPVVAKSVVKSPVSAQSPVLKVYEDPFTLQQQSPPKLAATLPVLEDKPVNEDAAKLQKTNTEADSANEPPPSPEKRRQNSRLLDSGINKIRAKSLEVHGFRKLQSLIRDNQTPFSDETFEALLIGLFIYLEDPLSELASDKAQDVKAQILATIKLLLKRERASFLPHVSRGLEALLQTRSTYDSRAHVVSGLELLADELVAIGDGTEIVVVLSKYLQNVTDTNKEGCRTLSMGLHVLKELLDSRSDFLLTETEVAKLTPLASRCLSSADSGVRMDAVKFCVALHARIGEVDFWGALKGVKDDPKSLITYYIVKRQREQGVIVSP